MSLESLRPLADHLWQSTVFAAAAGLLTLALRKNRARVRHSVWLAASVKFLIPVSVLIALGGQFTWVRSVRTVPQTTQAAALAVANQVSQPFAGPTNELPTAPVETDLVDLVPVGLFAIWACGFIGISCSWFVRWRRIRAVVRAASPLGLELPVQALSSNVLMEPGIFGIFRPALLLPSGILEHLPEAQLQAVIAHELCHVRNRDNFSAAFQMFVETVFWFHPMVWWIGKRMVAEREFACDEEVLRLGNQARVYAEGILSVCRLYVESPLACVSGVTGADLKERIRGIVSGRVACELGSARKAGLAMAGIASLVLPVLIGVWNASVVRGHSVVAVHPISASAVRFRSATITQCGSPAKYRWPHVVSAESGRLLLSCEPIVGLVQLAYLKSEDVYPQPRDPNPLAATISAAPGLTTALELDRFDIDARTDAKASPESMKGPMLQALLEDRFKVKVHGETRNVPALALTAPKGAAKLRKSDAGSCNDQWPRLFRPMPGKRDECVHAVDGRGKQGLLVGEAATLADLSHLLTDALGQQVIDKTGISGKYDFHLDFAGNELPGALGRLYPRLPEVLQEQLGLKLERSSMTREFLVIDQAQKPE